MRSRSRDRRGIGGAAARQAAGSGNRCCSIILGSLSF